MFSHEMRASIRKEHPEYAFGEISRIIGVEVIPTTAQTVMCIKYLNTLQCRCKLISIPVSFVSMKKELDFILARLSVS